MEYFLNEERKEALGMRAEIRGARRAEARKVYTKGFMMMIDDDGSSNERREMKIHPRLAD